MACCALLTACCFLPCLQSAKEVLRDSVLPSLTDASVQHALSSATLDTHLLGFETGGELNLQLPKR